MSNTHTRIADIEEPRPALWAKTLGVLGVSALALTACGDGDDDETVEADSEIEADIDSEDFDFDGVELLSEGTLQVCADVPYPPFEYYGEDGEVVGFDIDIAAGIADALDADLEVVQSSFDGIESGVALDAENCDLAISGMTITEEREGNMLFSDPYLDDNLGLLAAADSGISSVDDLDENSSVGVQQATTGAAHAEELGLDTVAYEDSGLMLQGLETGQVDAIIGNISIIGYQTGEDDSFEFVEEIDTGEQLGIAAQQDNQQLIDAVNEILAHMDETGFLEEAEQLWFESGDTPEEGDDPDAEDDDADDDNGEDDADDSDVDDADGDDADNGEDDD